jgi:hypothetical protein
MSEQSYRRAIRTCRSWFREFINLSQDFCGYGLGKPRNVGPCLGEKLIKSVAGNTVALHRGVFRFHLQNSS